MDTTGTHVYKCMSTSISIIVVYHTHTRLGIKHCTHTHYQNFIPILVLKRIKLMGTHQIRVHCHSLMPNISHV